MIIVFPRSVLFSQILLIFRAEAVGIFTVDEVELPLASSIYYDTYRLRE